MKLPCYELLKSFTVVERHEKSRFEASNIACCEDNLILHRENILPEMDGAVKREAIWEDASG